MNKENRESKQKKSKQANKKKCSLISSIYRPNSLKDNKDRQTVSGTQFTGAIGESELQLLQQCKNKRGRKKAAFCKHEHCQI